MVQSEASSLTRAHWQQKLIGFSVTAVERVSSSINCVTLSPHYGIPLYQVVIKTINPYFPTQNRQNTSNIV